jgi:hypothetical protein
MTGLTRAKDETRPQDAFTVMVLGGIERLTHALRKGDPFSEKALHDMQALDRRLRAFSDALSARLPLSEDRE